MGSAACLCSGYKLTASITSSPADIKQTTAICTVQASAMDQCHVMRSRMCRLSWSGCVHHSLTGHMRMRSAHMHPSSSESRQYLGDYTGDACTGGGRGG